MPALLPPAEEGVPGGRWLGYEIAPSNGPEPGQQNPGYAARSLRSVKLSNPLCPPRSQVRQLWSGSAVGVGAAGTGKLLGGFSTCNSE
jgi:hypothetical protein